MLINKVKVNDISIAYKICGEDNQGIPVLLIMGYGCTMDMWPVEFLDILSQHYKVIAFDNRGMGFTSSSEKEYSIELFAEDTAEFLNSLSIPKAHIVGWSMGSFICQELALNYPSLVEKIILYGGYSGGQEAIYADRKILEKLTDQSGTMEERIERMFSLLFPSEWLKEQEDLSKIFPPITEPISDENIARQAKAVANWKGVFNRLHKIKNPALLITGTDDVVILPENVFVMEKEIKGSSIIQISGGGHGVIYQYTKEFSNFVITFLEN
jgi:pimeloyl-ACP methyl ester carboxylesterase